MRVVRATGFGGPDVLVMDVDPEPVAGAGQVVIEVSVAPIDFIQTQLRRGFTPGPPLPEPPYVPGTGVAGTVVSVGDGVDAGWIRRRVVARTASGLGGNAERAVAGSDSLIPVPDALELSDAAALLDDGGTAIGLADNARVRPGEWVLVEAAGGGLGSLLVQLSRAAGAHVIGAARGAEKLDLAGELGAAAVLDYSQPGWTERLREITGGAGPDLVFDGVGGDIGRSAFEATARGGRFSVHGAASGAPTVIEESDATRRGVTVIGLDQLNDAFRAGTNKRAETAMSEAAAGRIAPAIGRTFPLERADRAHAAMEARTVPGKTLLLV